MDNEDIYSECNSEYLQYLNLNDLECIAYTGRAHTSPLNFAECGPPHTPHTAAAAHIDA